MGKAANKRKKETKWIQQQLKSKHIKKWPEIDELLRELQICYVQGANRAVHLIAVQLVKRYVVKIYALKDDELTSYLSALQEVNQNSADDKQMIVHHIRHNSSAALGNWHSSVKFIVQQEGERCATFNSKKARKLLRRLHDLFTA